jgi:ArsR family transcriptional regulator
LRAIQRLQDKNQEIPALHLLNILADKIMAQTTVTPEIAFNLASLFASLSDPTRILILATLLEGEIGVGELVERIGLSKSAVSHQLRGLRDKRLIRTRKQGRNVFVCLDDEHVIELFQRGLDHVLHG